MKHFNWQSVNENLQGNKPLEDGKVLVPKVSLEDIIPDPEQPRQNAEQSGVESLAESIKEVGLIHLITCFKRSDGKYQIVSGERRFWALQQAQKTHTDIILVDEKSTKKKKGRYLALQLVENIARKNLNPVEEAESLFQLLESNSYDQKTLASKLGKSASYITRSLGVRKIKRDIRQAMINASRKISQEVFWIMGEIPAKYQERAWKLIENNPTISKIKEVKEKFRSRKKKGGRGKAKSFTYQPTKSKWIKRIAFNRTPRSVRDIDEMIDELVGLRDQLKKKAGEFRKK